MPGNLNLGNDEDWINMGIGSKGIELTSARVPF